jgi:hypothetical protein
LPGSELASEASSLFDARLSKLGCCESSGALPEGDDAGCDRQKNDERDVEGRVELDVMGTLARRCCVSTGGVRSIPRLDESRDDESVLLADKLGCRELSVGGLALGGQRFFVGCCLVSPSLGLGYAWTPCNPRRDDGTLRTDLPNDLGDDSGVCAGTGGGGPVDFVVVCWGND